MPHQFTSNRFLLRHLAKYNIRTEEVTKGELTRPFQPTPVFLPGESHGQKSLVGYSPWGHKESDTTERLSTHTHTRYLECSSHTRGCWNPSPFLQPPPSIPSPPLRPLHLPCCPVSVTKRQRRLISLLLFGTPRPISSALQTTDTNPP